jgi:hypothetical protein
MVDAGGEAATFSKCGQMTVPTHARRSANSMRAIDAADQPKVRQGPLAIWAGLGHHARPVLHRAFGYAWTTPMILAAASAFFIHSNSPFSVAGEPEQFS